MEKGFIGSLFDLSFTEFVTTRIVKILYILSIIGSGMMGIALIIGGFAAESGAAGILSLILGPVVALLYILTARVWLELVIVIFRIAENTGRLVEHQTAEGTQGQADDEVKEE